MNFNLVRKMAMRDIRSGEMGLLLIALVVAVGTVTSISLFVDRLHQALLLESANFLAADRQISSSQPIPDNFVAEAEARELDLTQTMVFPSMVFVGDANQLVSVKAVGEKYPLRGKLIVSDEPFVRGFPIFEVPQPGEVWLDSRLFPALDVDLGEQIEVGLAELKVTRVLVSEPDRGGSFFDLGPRLLMNIADVPATEVVQPGSRIGYRLLIKGDEAVLADYKESIDLGNNYRWVSIRESSPRIGSALDRAESFLLLGGLLGVLLAGIAVALSAHRYAARHYDHVGVLKTLGATPQQILFGFLSILLLIGSVAITGGLLVGGLLHLLIVELLSSLIPITLPAPGMRPFLLGAATGLICALSFAMPAFIHLRDISPMRVIRRDLGVAPLSQWLSYGAALAGSLVLLVWYTKSLFLTFWTIVAAVVVVVVFGALALMLLRGSRVAGMQARSGWRLALSGLQRRRKENVAQILIFGMAIMLLLVLVLLRTELVTEWRSQVPEQAANHFVMNISSDEVAAVRSKIEQGATAGDFLYPMIRGRIVAVNGEESKAYQERVATMGGDERRIRSERNLTWTAAEPDNNVITQGDWWSQEDDVAEVSLEQEYADDFKLSLGDILTFDVGGREVDATITSFRTVEWESMSPNFFIILSPAALSDFPATYMTSFYLAREDKQFLNGLLRAHPTITVIEIDALIEQIKSIVDRVTQAVELVLGLVLISGCLVLVASIQASRDARMSEHALVRTLGGTRKLIGSSLFAEFLVLGLFAGVVAVFGAELIVAVLQYEVFELGVGLHPWVWPVGPIVGAVVIVVVGLLGARSLINSPPMLVLRGMN
ncbi:MAG: FtsX-like permease family protein [Pseudomonadales bacterium]|nr:FtsX-like permease family protein [Pseudomonadales bacterium]